MAKYHLGIVFAYLLMTQTANAANCGFNTCDFDKEYCDWNQGECVLCAPLCAIDVYNDKCPRLCPGYYNALKSSPPPTEKTTSTIDEAIKTISPNVTTEPLSQQTNSIVTLIVLSVLIVSIAYAVCCFICIKNGYCKPRKV